MDLRGWNERYLSGGRLRDDPDAAPTPLLMETARHLPAGKALDLIERAAIRQTMIQAHGNKMNAARTLGIAVSTLYEKLKRYGL